MFPLRLLRHPLPTLRHHIDYYNFPASQSGPFVLTIQVSQHLTTIALTENHHLSPPRPDSTPTRDIDNIMERTLPSSTNNFRPGTPLDSYCDRSLALTQEMNDLKLAIQATQTAINGYNAQGVSEGFLIDHQLRLQVTYKNNLPHVLLSSPCDTPNCTIHVTPRSTSVKGNLLEFPLSPKIQSNVKKTTMTLPPPLRKLSNNSRTNSDPEINFRLNLTNKCNALENSDPKTLQEAGTSSDPHAVNNIRSANPNASNPTTQF
ncbi:hypothetical protein TNCV_4694331 [Trichonephila clavipes]|uniref:Uncharacterized protein n=1 Tax=Trichonephila clavipes TaxID=2585209 RepID=A0A8X6WBW8_TRICX|nr:hypothetical protein TNCV_4694331 [Trichonephila clavipes]